MGLRNDILTAAKAKGWDPFKQPFQPKDLGLVASDYGSFSDHCVTGTTQSAQYDEDECLIAVQFHASGRPHKYLLR